MSHQLPESLLGYWGKNRLDSTPQIGANHDLEAIQSWLNEYKDSPETLRSYKREAERLILWCWQQQGRALSDLNRQDIANYQIFLADPQPRSLWCGDKRPRTSPHWRPFQGGLSLASQKQTLTILKGLFNYLRDADYLRGNPLALIKSITKQTTPRKTKRYLEQADIALLFEQLPMQADNAKSHREWLRERTLLAFLYYLAPRASEVASCKMNDFFQRRGRWWWRVLGKGKKYAEIPVPDALLSYIQRYRSHLELSPLPEPNDDTPFIRSIAGTSGISANMVYRLSKKILLDAAAQIEHSEPEQASRLRTASTHWFRHTAITHLADQGVDLRLVSKTARHSKLETTAIYFHAEDDAWHNAINPSPTPLVEES
ncbi:hypothetical protein BTE48_08145 [Oceanospirillum multiglobuliferum]|uniref:Integrase n=2 Tax=Oceanospirillum multiglobuliferum TaxID=64969 RepID=A0A1V4T4V1_9GAMM|nr:hypothetical protein BTE48_08145 [Oceanospirillum multiglobuliferum]